MTSAYLTFDVVLNKRKKSGICLDIENRSCSSN